MKTMKYLLCTIMLFALIACNKTPANYVNMTAEEAKTLLESNSDVYMINTHTPYQGEIPGTKVIIEEYDDIPAHIDQLPADKNTPILVTCRSGRMSAISSEQLIMLGYKRVYNLAGGMKAWREAGYELINATFE